MVSLFPTIFETNKISRPKSIKLIKCYGISLSWSSPNELISDDVAKLTQVEDVRPETTGSGKFPAISGSRIPKSIPGSGSDWFPANSGIRTLLTYPFVVSRAVPVSPHDDRIQARFPSDPVRILKPGSDRFRAVPPVSTTPQIPDSRANLRVPSSHYATWQTSN